MPSISVLVPTRTVTELAARTGVIGRIMPAARAGATGERKNGAPIVAVTMPIGSSAGAASVRAKVSATTSKAAPKQNGRWQQQAMARSDHKAQQVRDDEPDESDHAGDRDRRAGRRRDQHDANALEALDLDAGMEGFGLAEHEQVEAARDERHGERRWRRGTGTVAPTFGQVAPPSEPSSQKLMSRNWRSSARKQQAQAGIGQRRDRQAAEQEHGDRRAAFARRDAVENHGRRERAGERGERQHFDRQTSGAGRTNSGRRYDSGGGGKRGAVRHADQRGIGERIAEHALHASRRRRPAGRRRSSPSRCAAAGSTTAPASRGRRAPDRRRETHGGDQAMQRNAGRADGCGDGGRQHENGQQRRQHQEPYPLARRRATRAATARLPPSLPASLSSLRPSEGIGSRAERRIERHARDRARRARCAVRSRGDRGRPSRRAPLRGRGRGGEGGMREHGLGIEPERGALHGQDGVGAARR